MRACERSLKRPLAWRQEQLAGLRRLMEEAEEELSDVFSHRKSVLRKPTRPDVRLLYPPYKGLVETIVRKIVR